jgi:hypothetical protein
MRDATQTEARAMRDATQTEAPATRDATQTEAPATRREAPAMRTEAPAPPSMRDATRREARATRREAPAMRTEAPAPPSMRDATRREARAMRDATQTEAYAELISTGDSTLLVPIAAKPTRPLLVVLLSAGIDAQAECASLAATIRMTHFVLCQSSVSSATDAADVSATDRAESRLMRAVDATLSRYPGQVAPRQLALVGVGTAADAVVAIVRRSPEHFTRVGLIEGGFEAWSSVDSARFAQAGGKAFLVVSSDAAHSEATRVTATVKALGVRARYESAARASKASLAELLHWLMKDE